MTEHQIESKFMRVLLIFISVVFIFAGPTYFALILDDVLKLGSSAAMVAGFIVFLVGAFDLVYLVRKKVIV
jgi:hypothetical protein